MNQKLPIHDPKPFILPRESVPANLYNVPNGTASTTIIADRDPITGDILDFIEIELENAECTAENSMSLRRAPNRPELATRYFSYFSNVFFLPSKFEVLQKMLFNVSIK